MVTSIGVPEATRDRLEAVKREYKEPSLAATIDRLLTERTAREAKVRSAHLVESVLRHQKDLAAFARRNAIRSMALFGSTIHGDATSKSDLDLLVEFHPQKTPGFIRMGVLVHELSELLGVEVDMQTPAALHPAFRDEVLREALTFYAAS